MKRARFAVVLWVALAMSGCVESTLLMRVRPDGSGHVTMTTRLHLSGMRAIDALFAEDPMAARRPPEINEELPPPGEGQLFQEFGTRVRLVSTRLDAAPDGGVRTTDVEFDDVRQIQMIFPPLTGLPASGFYGSSLVKERPLLTFALRPHEDGDELLLLKLPDPKMADDPNGPMTSFQTDSPQERLFEQAIKNLSLELIVETEQPLLRTNAPRQEGNRATILDLDLDRMINAMDETRSRRMMAPGSFQELLWQIADLPGATVPTEPQVFLEFQPAAEQQPPPPPPPAVQAPPDTEIYLAPLATRNGTITVGAPANITNNPGYDNQPFFTPDGRSILFTSVRGPSAGRGGAALTATDIYRYDLASRSIARVTDTPEGEYSPTPMLDGRRISAVTVEADGTQRLYAVTPGAPAMGRGVLLPDVKPVGYHAWADDHTVALFVLGGNGTPATLQLADTRSGQARVVATDVGRSIQRMPGAGDTRHISFVQREHDGDRVALVVKELDPASGGITTLTPAVEGSRDADLAWMPDGTLLMAKEDVLYAWRRGQSGWTAVVALPRLSLRGVSRLAVSPKGDWLALVCAAPAPSGR